MKQVLVFALVLLSAVAALADLRILDQRGLVRGIAAEKESYRVTLKISSGGTAWLAHEDGIAPDQHGSEGAPGTIIFKAVPSGNWRIKTSSPQVSIIDVEIG